MDTVLNAVIELVKQGGPYALWGLAIWGFLRVCLAAVVLVVLYLSVSVICQCITTNYKVSKELRDSRITLISKEVSDKLSQTLEQFSKDYQDALRELKKQTEDSKKS